MTRQSLRVAGAVPTRRADATEGRRRPDEGESVLPPLIAVAEAGVPPKPPAAAKSRLLELAWHALDPWSPNSRPPLAQMPAPTLSALPGALK